VKKVTLEKVQAQPRLIRVVRSEDLQIAYRQMAQQVAREAEALAWAEATVAMWPRKCGDVQLCSKSIA